MTTVNPAFLILLDYAYGFFMLLMFSVVIP